MSNVILAVDIRHKTSQLDSDRYEKRSRNRVSMETQTKRFYLRYLLTRS